MIETVFSAALPVGERLIVKKNRIEGCGGRGPRIAVVTGIHGDGLEGQFVAFELAQRLRERIGDLRGIVDIYPALNPLGISASEHGVPLFDLDLDRTFPGNSKGNMNEALAAAIVADIKGANACIDIHAPDAHLREVSQVRVEDAYAKTLMPFAQLLNTQLVWMHGSSNPQRSTLAHTLNSLRTRTLVVEMGESLRITEDAGSWLTEGILRLDVRPPDGLLKHVVDVVAMQGLYALGKDDVHFCDVAHQLFCVCFVLQQSVALMPQDLAEGIR